jgi:hypothetical protein
LAPELGFPSHSALVDEQTFPLFPHLRRRVLEAFHEAYSEPQFILVVATAAVDEYLSTGALG